jgi:hypothetical protein
MNKTAELNAAEEEVAQKYRAEGYRVIPGTRDILPKELQSYIPDFIAIRDDQHVAIEVKTRDTHYDAKKTRKVAELFRKVPGWRFDLVMLGDELEASPGPKLLTKEVCQTRLRSADRLASETRDFSVAVLLIWTAVEAALRARIGETDRPRVLTAARLAKEAFSLGLITKAEWEKLDRLAQIRNQVVHGEEPVSVTKRTFEKARAIAARLVEEVPQW